MQIQHAHIQCLHVHLPAQMSELSAAFVEGEALTKAGGAMGAGIDGKPKYFVPAIATPWPDVDGTYVGVSRGEDGEPDGHLVLLNATPGRPMNWHDGKAWAESLGDGARLPTRFESALIYANARDHVDTGSWHLTGTRASSSAAWGQDFRNGRQFNYDLSAEGAVRAVRRYAL